MPPPTILPCRMNRRPQMLEWWALVSKTSKFFCLSVLSVSSSLSSSSSLSAVFPKMLLKCSTFSSDPANQPATNVQLTFLCRRCTCPSVAVSFWKLSVAYQQLCQRYRHKFRNCSALAEFWNFWKHAEMAKYRHNLGKAKFPVHFFPFFVPVFSVKMILKFVPSNAKPLCYNFHSKGNCNYVPTGTFWHSCEIINVQLVSGSLEVLSFCITQ